MKKSHNSFAFILGYISTRFLLALAEVLPIVIVMAMFVWSLNYFIENRRHCDRAYYNVRDGVTYEIDKTQHVYICDR